MGKNELQPKFTPGPWKVTSIPSQGLVIHAMMGENKKLRWHGEFTYKPDVYVPIFTEIWVQFETKEYREMQEANALLMIHAPGMYAIIEELVSLTECEDPVEVGCHCTDSGEYIVKCVWCRAKDIISEATNPNKMPKGSRAITVGEANE